MEELKPCPYSRPQISHAVDRMTLAATNHEPSYLWPVDCYVALWALKNITLTTLENKPDMSEIDRVIRLYEDAAECPCDTYAQLILAALHEYKAQHIENKLTLDELRKMDGDWVWLIDTEHPEYDGWYNVRPFHDESGGIELYGVDNNYYERAITAGSVKVYTRNPEGNAP